MGSEGSNLEPLIMNDIFNDVALQFAETKEAAMTEFIKEQGFDSYQDLKEKGYEIVHEGKGHVLSEGSINDTFTIKLVKILNTKTINIDMKLSYQGGETEKVEDESVGKTNEDSE